MNRESVFASANVVERNLFQVVDVEYVSVFVSVFVSANVKPLGTI